MTTIAANVIFIWTGTAASIPAGWTRETALDAKYQKGTANGVNPGGTGGALTHQHATANHNHTTAHGHSVPDSSAGVGQVLRAAGPNNPPTGHTHLSNPPTSNPTTPLADDTPATTVVNHEPSHMEVIFIKSDGTPTGLPDKAVGLWNNNAGTPVNWNLCDGGGAPARPDMRLRWAKGAAAAGDGGAIGGGLTHGHGIASHTHSTPWAHTHPNVVTSVTGAAAVAGAAGSLDAASGNHTHSLTVGSTSPAVTGNTDTAAASDHQPPYWVLAWIQNNAAALDFPDRIIGLWLGTLASIPAYWRLCDGTGGTPDLRSLFVKGANTLGGIGGSGGSLTHGAAHTATGHTHPVQTHAHTLTDQANGANQNRPAGAVGTASLTHTHTFANTTPDAFTSGAGTPMVNNYTDTQPPYVDVAFIQWVAPVMLIPSGIATAESLGTAKLRQTFYAAGIASAEAFGAARLARVFQASGIASAEAFGAAKLRLILYPVGIASLIDPTDPAYFNVELIGEIDLDGDGAYANANANISAVIEEATWTCGFINPFDNLPRDSTATIIVRNDDQRFSPEHANGLVGLTIGRRLRLKASLKDGAIVKQMYVGWISSINPAPGMYGSMMTRIDCTGWFQRIAKPKISIPLQENKRSDEVVEAVVRKMVKYPPGFVGYWLMGRGRIGYTTRPMPSWRKMITAEQGRATYLYGGDWSKDVSGYGALRDVAAREGGKLFIGRNGLIEEWNRHHTIKDQVNSVNTTLDNTMADIDYVYPNELINRVTVRYRPHKVSQAPEVLGVYNATIQVPANDFAQVTIQFATVDSGAKVAGKNILAPVGGADYIATADEAGAGESSTASLSASVQDVAATSCTVVITNSSSSEVWVQPGLQVKGIAITDYAEARETVDDAASIATVGGVYELEYSGVMETQAEAQTMAKALLRARKIRGLAKSVSVNPYYSPQRMLDAILYTVGDRIAIKEEQTGHSQTHYIIGETHAFKKMTGYTAKWYLEPVLSQTYWLMGNATYSRIGHTTRPVP